MNKTERITTILCLFHSLLCVLIVGVSLTALKTSMTGYFKIVSFAYYVAVTTVHAYEFRGFKYYVKSLSIILVILFIQLISNLILFVTRKDYISKNCSKWISSHPKIAPDNPDCEKATIIGGVVSFVIYLFGIVVVFLNYRERTAYTKFSVKDMLGINEFNLFKNHPKPDDSQSVSSGASITNSTNNSNSYSYRNSLVQNDRQSTHYQPRRQSSIYDVENRDQSNNIPGGRRKSSASSTGNSVRAYGGGANLSNKSEDQQRISLHKSVDLQSTFPSSTSVLAAYSTSKKPENIANRGSRLSSNSYYHSYSSEFNPKGNSQISSISDRRQSQIPSVSEKRQSQIPAISDRRQIQISSVSDKRPSVVSQYAQVPKGQSNQKNETQNLTRNSPIFNLKFDSNVNPYPNQPYSLNARRSSVAPMYKRRGSNSASMNVLLEVDEPFPSLRRHSHDGTIERGRK